MTKVLTFEFEDDKYIIKEGSTIVFSIDSKELIFHSLDFYNGIYKDGKPTQIVFEKNIQADTAKKGEYIYNWLNQIVSHIAEAFKEVEPNIDETVEYAVSG